MKKARGASFIEIVLAAAAFFVSIFFLLSTVTQAQKGDARALETNTAQSYAVELLEFFASHPSTLLQNRLAVNPVNAAKPSYQLCAHINLLDRASQKTLNRDPLAALPPDSPLNKSAAQPANRYYLVQVVNTVTMATRNDLCDTAFSALPALAANERFLVTVGVSWNAGTNISHHAVTGMVP